MGYKILLADDDRDLLEMLGRYFEMKGYQILQAGNGTEAVRMSAEEPDLILLDINMPGMDGFISAVAIVPCIWKRERKLSMCSKVRKREVMMNGCNGV